MDEIETRAERAGEALEALADGPAQRAADAMERAFERAGSSIERSLARAASGGEASFERLTQAILRDLTRLAAEQFIEKPLSQAIGQALGAIDFFGARAEGGPVTAGGAYLVGERGPELFVPPGGGAIHPAAGAMPPVQVHITLGPGADARQVAGSEARIARTLARAVAKGARGA